MSRNALITIVVLVALGIIASVVVSRYYNAPNDTANDRQEVVTLQGSLICLPHRDTSGPTTMECAYGIRTANGVNYALDASAFGGVMGEYSVDDEIEVTGILVAREELPAEDRRLIYDIAGVIEVAGIEAMNTEFDRQVLAGGQVMIDSPQDFGLAVTADQVLVESNVPPCDDGFDYCLYYNGNEYQGTNFQSAGLRINIRDDLEEADACLSTPPAGYDDLEADISESTGYSISTFSPIQNAAAGHYSDGTLYRLAVDGSCYEIETRIGESQFENYEEGTIQEFTEADRQAVQDRLDALLGNIRLVGNEGTVIFSS